MGLWFSQSWKEVRSMMFLWSVLRKLKCYLSLLFIILSSCGIFLHLVRYFLFFSAVRMKAKYTEFWRNCKRKTGTHRDIWAWVWEAILTGLPSRDQSGASGDHSFLRSFGDWLGSAPKAHFGKVCPYLLLPYFCRLEEVRSSHLQLTQEINQWVREMAIKLL